MTHDVFFFSQEKKKGRRKESCALAWISATKVAGHPRGAVALGLTWRTFKICDDAPSTEDKFVCRCVCV